MVRRRARGDQASLDAIRQSDEFLEIESRGVLCLRNFVVVGARINEGLQKNMQIWQKNIPAR